MKFRLLRHKETEYATYGVLYTIDGEKVCVTIERPFVDADNDGVRDPNVCRIQHGTYDAVRAVSPKREIEVWWLCSVPDVTPAPPAVLALDPTATTCQFHIANFPTDLEGCIGVGKGFGNVLNKKDGKTYPGITGSGLAFRDFMRLTAGARRITTEIVDMFGAPAGTWA